ncbi:MAG TPA: hypothetical protein VLZ30_01395 [Verrucomicrobiae bacterium]|nr:hypothetical protein [Verrucomicrobiae bacterium]
MVKLITENREILALVVLLGITLLSSILLHWTVICTCLYRHGARFPTGLLFWRVFRELRRYRNLTSRVGKPLSLYYFAFILAWFNLLLALAITLRMLWFQSHPNDY